MEVKTFTETGKIINADLEELIQNIGLVCFKTQIATEITARNLACIL